MHVADGGGYAGATNWFQYNVGAMWGLVENQEPDNYWKHVGSWKKVCDLTLEHLTRMKEYRDNLAAAWPPEKSPASRAFIDRLDYLIDHVQKTHDAASANYTALQTASSALHTSRHEIKKIYDEYVAKKVALQDYKDRKEKSLLPLDWFEDAPTTDAELEQMNAKARTVMYGLSGALVEARARVQKPPPYRASGRDGGDDQYSGALAPPPPAIPPLVPIPGPPPPPAMPAGSPAPPPSVVPTPSAPGVGPVLGGAAPIAPPAPTPPTMPAVITPTPAPTPSPVMPPGMPIVPGLPGTGKTGLPTTGRIGGVGPGPGGLPISPVTGTPSTPLSRPGTGIGSGAPRVMPPGGMINAAPGTGLGQPVAPAHPARRINPVGGVIGDQGRGTIGGPGSAVRGSQGRGAVGGPGSGITGGQGRPGIGGERAPLGGGTGMPGSHSGQPIAPNGARPGVAGGPGRDSQHQRRGDDWQHHGRGDNEHGRRWDPQNPWETDEGVASVMRPSRENGRIDPGPAIGLDR